MLLAPMVAVKRTLALSDAGIYKPRPRLVGVVGESLVEELLCPMLCPETMLYQHFSAREDADTAMLTFSLGTGNLCDIVRGKRYGTGCAQIMI